MMSPERFWLTVFLFLIALYGIPLWLWLVVKIKPSLKEKLYNPECLESTGTLVSNRR